MTDRVQLRAATEADAGAIARILAEPEVARWWGPYDAERIRREMGEYPGSFAIVVDGELAGWLLFHEETDPEYRHVALDIGLTASLHGRGLGSAALRLAIRHFIAQGHHRFTIDPSVSNERAIRAYEAVGFKPVGVMRQYERASSGEWRDGLLMDLLADEFEG